MTAWERILTTLNHEEPDRVPIWTILDNADVLRHFAPADVDLGPLSSEEAEGRWTLLMKLHKAAITALGIDGTFLCGVGAIDPFPREAAETKSSSSDRPRFQTVDDVRNYRPRVPDDSAVEAARVDLFRRAQAELGDAIAVANQEGSCLEAAAYELGFEMFSYTLVEAPAEIGRLLEIYMEQGLAYNRVAARHKLAPVWQISGDIAYKGGTFFSPEFMRREYFPRLKKQLAPFKENGMKVIYHTDGDVTEVIPDLIEAGVDALNPVETTAGMDLASVKKQFGKDLAFVGNVDANIMSLGSAGDVEAEVERCIREGAGGGGLMLDTGAGEIAPWATLDNVIAMCEAVHKHGNY